MFGSFALLLGVALGLQGGLHDPVPKSFVLIVSGVGGEPEYAEQFYAAGSQLAKAMHVKQGVPESRIFFLAEDSARDSSHIRGMSTKVEVEKAFAKIIAEAASNDLVLVVLIGHGDNQDGESRFNLKGPDLSAADFAALLKPLAKQRVAFVNAASASAGFIAALTGPDRVIITANSTLTERNNVRFSKYFAAAYNDSTSDKDHDGRTSLLEAYLAARKGVEEDYASGQEIVTEHARLDDNGDGAGTESPRRIPRTENWPPEYS